MEFKAEQFNTLLSIHISSAPHLQDDDSEMLVFNTVQDSIVSSTYSIDIVLSSEFPRMIWPWFTAQFLNTFENNNLVFL